MHRLHRSSHGARAAIALSALALLSGCGTDARADDPPAAPTTTSAAVSTTMAHGTGDMGHEMMAIPKEAKDWKATISSPAPDTVITANEVVVDFQAVGFELACDRAGGHNSATGHIHVLLDDALVNMFCGTTATISMQNVDPGRHEIEVVPTVNDHTEVLDGAAKVAFEYHPNAPLPVIDDEEQEGEPAIRIVSPVAGSVLTGEFDVVVEVTGLELDCSLYGKDRVAGYGHWHLNWDTTIGPMMGMMTMAGMSCTNTFRASTAGLEPGSQHSMIALLVDNGHMPLDPPAESVVDFTVGPG